MAKKKSQPTPGVIILRVHPRVTLPHMISGPLGTFTFQPDAEVPEKYAESLLKTYPDRYTVADGPADMSLYHVNLHLNEERLKTLVIKLTKPQKLALMEMVEGLTGENTTERGRFLSSEFQRLLTEEPESPSASS